MRVAIVFITLFCSVCFSQKDFIVKIEVLPIAGYIISKNVSFGIVGEKGIGKNYSLNFGAGGGHAKLTYSAGKGNRIDRGYLSTLFLKKYFSKTRYLKKWYSGIYLINSFRRTDASFIDSAATYSNYEYGYDINYLSTGLIGGYQLCTINYLTIDFYLGFGIQYRTLLKTRYQYNIDAVKSERARRRIDPSPALSLSIGYNLSGLYDRYKTNKQKKKGINKQTQ
ncbi:MAG: DUF3575 domain-containing protein [Bacteroidetes bacterium]|nr:DUF3575 domain-containing protein [Bacteroidota bacterium]